MTPTPPVPPAQASGITDLAKNQISALIQKGLTVAATAMLAHHVDASTVSSLSALVDPASIANELVLIGMVIWHWWDNKRHNTKLVVAVNTGFSTATPTKADTVMLLKAGILPAKPVSAATEAAATAPLAVPPVPPAK